MEDVTAAKSRPSLRGAIDAHCKECIYDPDLLGSGSWRGQVEACTVTKCSLYGVRPMKIRRSDGVVDQDE